MSKRQARFNQGQQARLDAEVNAELTNTPVRYHCVYLRFDDAHDYKQGWNSVTKVDINVAIMRASGTLASAHQQVLNQLRSNP